jgi:WbqC-like protein family
MKVAIHQPQYFPYGGFFQKVSLSDLYVIMDDAQYDKRFTNRNRIIAPNGPIWISVPINKKQKFSPNLEVEINNEMAWRDLHWRRLQLSYNNSRFFHLYKGYFEQLYKKEWKMLFDIDLETLRQVISWLGLKTEIILESELGVKSKSTQRLVDVCKAVGADTYVAGSGSKRYMEESLFSKNDLHLEYQNWVPIEYQQHLAKEFVPNLSIIDLLANMGPDALKVLRGESPLVLVSEKKS